MTLTSQRLFLIDAFGAVLSAFSLGVILVQFESFIGMPRQVLYFLASLACVFAVYSFTCYFRNLENWRPYLKMIAIVNLLYCCISMGFVIYYFSVLTVLGLLYFIGEKIIVVSLAMIEFRTATK